VAAMTSVHVALAWLTVAATIGLLVVSVSGAISGRPSRTWIDRFVLVQLVAAGAALVVGLVVAATASPPADPLHFVYALVVVTTLPIARYLTHGRSDTSLARWMAVAILVVMGGLLRSFMTGR
jgi:hypothetical protein